MAAHSDNSVVVRSRRIIKLYNVGAERIMNASEEEKMEMTLKAFLQARLSRVNTSLNITDVNISAQSYLFGEVEPQLEMVLTVSGRYIPPPLLHFEQVLMEEMSHHLDLYKNRLIALDDQYFKTLRSVEITGYHDHLPARTPITTKAELKDELKKQRTELSEKKRLNPYHYSLLKEPIPEQSERDVSVSLAYEGVGNNNYKSRYTIEDGSTSHITFVALLLSSLSLVLLVLATVYVNRQHKRQRIEGTPMKTRPKFNLKQFLLPSNEHNPKVHFQGVTDVDLRDAKAISFRGVMDYENKPQPVQPYVPDRNQKHVIFV